MFDMLFQSKNILPTKLEIINLGHVAVDIDENKKLQFL